MSSFRPVTLSSSSSSSYLRMLWEDDTIVSWPPPPTTPRTHYLPGVLDLCLKGAEISNSYVSIKGRMYGIIPHQKIREEYQGTHEKLSNLVREGDLFFIVDGKHQFCRLPNPELKHYIKEHTEQFDTALKHIGDKYNAHSIEFSQIIKEGIACSNSLPYSSRIDYRGQIKTFFELEQRLRGLVKEVQKDMQAIQMRIRSNYPITRILETQDVSKLRFPLTVPHLFGGERLMVIERDWKDTIKILRLFYEGCSQSASCSAQSSRIKGIDGLDLAGQASLASSSRDMQVSSQSFGYLDLLESQSSYQQRWLMTLRQVQHLLKSTVKILQFESTPYPLSKQIISAITDFENKLLDFYNFNAFDSIVSHFISKQEDYTGRSHSLDAAALNFLNLHYQFVLKDLNQGKSDASGYIAYFRKYIDEITSTLNAMTDPCLPGQRLNLLEHAENKMSAIQTAAGSFHKYIQRCLEIPTKRSQKFVLARDQVQHILDQKLPQNIRFRSLIPEIESVELTPSMKCYEENIKAYIQFMNACAQSYESTAAYFKDFSEKLGRFDEFCTNTRQLIVNECAHLNAVPDIDVLMGISLAQSI